MRPPKRDERKGSAPALPPHLDPRYLYPSFHLEPAFWRASERAQRRRERAARLRRSA